nr:hypothetical protein [Paracoccus sp. SSJ]
MVGAAVDHIVSGVAVKRIVSGVAVDQVLIIATIDEIGATPGINPVVSFVAVNRVGMTGSGPGAIPDDGIISSPAIQQVGPHLTLNIIVAGATKDGVIAVGRAFYSALLQKSASGHDGPFPS